MVEAGVGREVEDALGVVGGGIVDARAAARTGGGFFEDGAAEREADLGEAKEDDAEDGAGVFLGLQAGVGAKLVGAVPEAFFEGLRKGVLLGRGDPLHRPVNDS